MSFLGIPQAGAKDWTAIPPVVEDTDDLSDLFAPKHDRCPACGRSSVHGCSVDCDRENLADFAPTGGRS